MKTVNSTYFKANLVGIYKDKHGIQHKEKQCEADAWSQGGQTTGGCPGKQDQCWLATAEYGWQRDAAMFFSYNAVYAHREQQDRKIYPKIRKMSIDSHCRKVIGKE